MKLAILISLGLVCTSLARVGDTEEVVLLDHKLRPTVEIKGTAKYLTFRESERVYVYMFRNGKVGAECIYSKMGGVPSTDIDTILRSYSPPSDWQITDIGVPSTVCMCSPKAQVCMMYGSDGKLFILGRSWIRWQLGKDL